MSEQAILYLGCIGLLGEYCPIFGEETPLFSKRVGCMHRVPFQEHTEFCGCSLAQPSVTKAVRSFCSQESIIDTHFLTSTVSFF